MFALAGERQPLANNEVCYYLLKAQDRHETRVESDWERGLAPVLADALSAVIGTVGQARTAAILASGSKEDRSALATDMARLFVGFGETFPSWVGADAVAEATARVAQIIGDSGPSAEDAASWAPLIVAGAGTYVLACAIADGFDVELIEASSKSS